MPVLLNNRDPATTLAVCLRRYDALMVLWSHHCKKVGQKEPIYPNPQSKDSLLHCQNLSVVAQMKTC